MSSFDILVYILSATLFVFLALAITAFYYAIKVFKELRSLTHSAKTTIENVEALTRSIKDQAANSFVSSIFTRIAEKFSASKKGKKEMKKSNKNIAVIAGASLLSGLAAGLLFAPKSGKQTREDIRQAVGKAQKKAVKTIHQVDFEVKKIVKKLEPVAAKLSKKAKLELAKAVDKAKKASKQAATVLKAFREGSASDNDLDNTIKELKDAKINLVKYLKK